MHNDNAAFVDHQPTAQRLPRGSSSLPKDIVDREQRRRLVQGIATAVTEKGYAAVTVADVTRIAGVSRSTFYALFKDKEDCFLYGLQKLADAQMTEVEAEYAQPRAKHEALLAALYAYTRRINLDMNLSQAFIAEAPAATPKVREIFEQAILRFQASLQRWLEDVQQNSPELPAISAVRMALVMSALKAYIISTVRAGQQIDDDQVLEIYHFILSSFGIPHPTRS